MEKLRYAQDILPMLETQFRFRHEELDNMSDTAMKIFLSAADRHANEVSVHSREHLRKILQKIRGQNS